MTTPEKQQHILPTSPQPKKDHNAPFGENSSPEDSPKAVACGCCPIPRSGPTVENAGGYYATFTRTDFLHFRTLADDMGPKLTLRYAKNGVFSWDQPAPAKTSKFNLVKVYAVFDVPGDVMYDVLHDPVYRKEWDENMIKGYNICQLNAHNDIGYYCVKTPNPSSNRDFCNQRAWIALPSIGEFIILNTSVPHTSCPEVKGVVRAFSLISGYFIRPAPGGGCSVTYLTQSNPSGWLPSALINSLTAKHAPSLMTKLLVAARNYTSWKAHAATSTAYGKPWRMEEEEGGWPEGTILNDTTPDWVRQYSVEKGGANPGSPSVSPPVSPRSVKSPASSDLPKE